MHRAVHNQPSTLAADTATPRSLMDCCGRRIDHLRLSVTPHCDLRCIYCRPDGKPTAVTTREPLSDERRVEFVRFLHARYGLAQVRVTGGEPLVYAPVVEFIAALRRALPTISLAMTTNGRLLRHHAAALRDAGLDRLNVSLDSLRPATFHRITGGNLDDVLAGLEAARQAGFPPPKINVVVIQDINADEVVEIARWGLGRGSEVRFLEAMPIGAAAESNRATFVRGRDILARLGEAFELRPCSKADASTAQLFHARGPDVEGGVGLITSLSEPFCAQCRRVRLTADGRLFACLLDPANVDMKQAWHSGSFDATCAADLLEEAVAAKQLRGPGHQPTAMTALGG